MTVRSVRLPDALWKALLEGLQQANVGRKRKIVLAEFIRGLLERGLSDPRAFEEIGSKVVRPARVLVPVLPAVVASMVRGEQGAETPAKIITIANTTAAVVAERLRAARISTGLPAGKIVDQICQLSNVPQDARASTRRELYNATLGDPLAAPLGLVAIDAATR